MKSVVESIVARPFGPGSRGPDPPEAAPAIRLLALAKGLELRPRRTLRRVGGLRGSATPALIVYFRPLRILPGTSL